MNYSKIITTNSYHLNGYGNELFYDEVEINLCGGLNSGFERNLGGLYDVFSGQFGILKNASDINLFHIHIIKSKLLDQRMKELLEECNQENKFIKIFFH
jgi:hypothetical protein